jgi:hypothetical protein
MVELRFLRAAGFIPAVAIRTAGINPAARVLFFILPRLLPFYESL